MKIKTVFTFIITQLVCHSAGIVGSLFTVREIPGWYDKLQKPAFTPPNWLFAPAWLTLYTLMGIALFLVVQKGLISRQVKIAAAVFIAHLFLNAAWSILFFGHHLIGVAFFELIVLWISILASIILFYRISKPAGLLLLPYILWVSYAGALNYSIWRLNS